MKRFILFFLTAYVSCSGVTDVHRLSILDSKSFVIQAYLPGKSQFYFNGFDSFYRNSSLPFLNRTNKDSVIYKTISSSKAIVYTFYGGESGTEAIPFFVLPGDTLRLHFANNNFSEMDLKSPYCLLNYFPQQTLQASFTETNLENVSKKELINKLSDIEQGYLHRTKLINEMAAKGTDSSFFNLLRKYNKIYKFNEVCKLNFGQRADTSVFYKLLEPYHKEMRSAFVLFDEIQCYEIKRILYKTILFESRTNQTAGMNIWDKLSEGMLPSSNYMDGFFYDVLKNDPALALLSDRKTALRKITPFLKNKEIFKELIEYQKVNLPGQVLQSLLEDPQGKPLNLKEAIKGKEKIIVLDFWASWCVPCQTEIPSMKKMEKQFEGRVKFIKITLDEDRSKWKGAMSKHKLLSYSYFNPIGSESPLNGYFNLGSIPRYVVLTNSGKVISKDFFRPSEINFKTELDNILQMDL